MKTILNNIIINKLNWISNYKKKIPLNFLKLNIKKSKRFFYKSLKKNYTVFILECKKASPSKGIIRENFNISKIVSIYKKYANVISVITDEKYFCGNFKFLLEASKNTNLPILCKDFIIDEYQIYLARYYKADAILLMLSILNNKQYRKLELIAKKLNMGILTEILTENDLKRAINLKAKIIGINNRNLNNLNIDLERTKKLSIKIPKNIIIISESGINNNIQIRKISKYVNGFLIGSTLMSEKDLNFSVCKLLLGENKICGLTCRKDIKIVYKNGIIYGGLIFIKNSIRKINVKKAFNIISNIHLKYIGVFKNKNIKNIIKISEYLQLYAIQLHGDENQNYINILRKLLPKKIQIWKALKIFKKIPKRKFKYVEKYIFDNKNGGTGKKFNWNLIKKEFNLNNVILAGGINIKNCIEAINLGVIGLDFNSSIEIKPGFKNKKILNSLFNILRNY
ncbi:MAG: bifunctional indole-3-glycerol-phosphate synthase TrpC/phosphoribosylanthranilate isomerase TrpF [Enterobacteriaceae bacterium PSpicST2]|nr:MAG: bifunctional indole-3-glycerol-phosphate synthase TrpC/phosphoribosylanthranilate isomerase TrpF [Enterobacteriaceae bacterium PSpicST2]WMC19042.1 MAG: bifunctional indole-3-glycerol-phosphate synthase TrpC/phosphoribosylanthranilate isomerase TrpF [Enterobacteriaceae bacterium PSpicST1]